MPESLQWFADLYAHYGYGVLFAGVMLENAGIPLPGETALLAAAFLASPAAGSRLSILAVIGIATLAAILGDNLGYWIGRRWARRRIERGQRFFFLTVNRMERAERYFKKYGVLTIFFGRFVAVLRIAAGPAAGVAGMAWWRFILANAAGAVVWATAISLIGYYAGGAWEQLQRWLGNAAWIIPAAILLGVLIAHFLPRFISARQRRGSPGS